MRGEDRLHMRRDAGETPKRQNGGSIGTERREMQMTKVRACRRGRQEDESRVESPPYLLVIVVVVIIIVVIVVVLSIIVLLPQ